jgi:hypothetical protein
MWGSALSQGIVPRRVRLAKKGARRSCSTGLDVLALWRLGPEERARLEQEVSAL